MTIPCLWHVNCANLKTVPSEKMGLSKSELKMENYKEDKPVLSDRPVLSPNSFALHNCTFYFREVTEGQ